MFGHRYFGIRFFGARYFGEGGEGATPATSYTLTGSDLVVVGQSSGPFTVTPDGLYTGTITFDDDGAGGTFVPPELDFVASAAPQSVGYIAAAEATITISTTSDPSLDDPDALEVEAIEIEASADVLVGLGTALGGGLGGFRVATVLGVEVF